MVWKTAAGCEHMGINYKILALKHVTTLTPFSLRWIWIFTQMWFFSFFYWRRQLTCLIFTEMSRNTWTIIVLTNCLYWYSIYTLHIQKLFILFSPSLTQKVVQDLLYLSISFISLSLQTDASFLFFFCHKSCKFRYSLQSGLFLFSLCYDNSGGLSMFNERLEAAQRFRNILTVNMRSSSIICSQVAVLTETLLNVHTEAQAHFWSSFCSFTYSTAGLACSE